MKIFSFSYLSLLLFTLLTITAGNVCLAQNGTVNLDAKKKQFLIGEQIKLHLEVKAPVTAKIIMPSFRDTLTNKIEIIASSPVDTIYPDNDVTSQIMAMNLVVTSFDTGYHVIPPIAVIVADDTLLTLPVLLSVSTIQVTEEEEIKPIKEPLEVKFSFLEWVLDNWVILTSIILVFILLSIYYLFFYKKKPEIKEAAPVIPEKAAHVIALEKLDSIRERKLWQNGLLKEYHSEISEVLREYIENRFQINAPEQTTDEIIHNIRYLDIIDVDKNKLRQVLMLSDMVKFAKEKPLSNENEQSLTNAVDFIKSTKVKKEQITEEKDQKDKQDTSK